MKLPFSYGFPMVFLWFSYGFLMVFLWFSCGFPMVFLWFIVDSPIFQMVSYEPIPQLAQLLHFFVKEQLRRKGLERNALDFPDQAIHLPGAQWAAIQWAFPHHLCH